MSMSISVCGVTSTRIICLGMVTIGTHCDLTNENFVYLRQGPRPEKTWTTGVMDLTLEKGYKRTEQENEVSLETNR